jgi:Trp operon repressor
MGIVKLTPAKVRNIKKLLLEGNLTQEQIGKKYSVNRCQITKIRIGMENPDSKNARWSHITIEPQDRVVDVFKLTDF